jgi:hypothetical protein
MITEVTAPSGVVLRTLPSRPSSVTVVRPSGPIIERLVTPVGRLTIEKVFVRPI